MMMPTESNISYFIVNNLNLIQIWSVVSGLINSIIICAESLIEIYLSKISQASSLLHERILEMFQMPPTPKALRQQTSWTLQKGAYTASLSSSSWNLKQKIWIDLIRNCLKEKWSPRHQISYCSKNLLSLLVIQYITHTIITTQT